MASGKSQLALSLWVPAAKLTVPPPPPVHMDLGLGPDGLPLQRHSLG